ncbi:MAG: FAD-linked oxidase C-terminal domain-containing protein [Pseudomonadota bacterium]
MSLPAAFLSELGQGLVGRLLTDPADCWPYGYDNSRGQVLPLAVVFPESSTEVQTVLRGCHRFRVPVTPRGAGTNTTGASIPDPAGIVLCLGRMNRILEMDPANRLARVEPGLTNQALQEALEPLGFFWPPDPTSATVCTLGGNLACNAAGPRAVKYGTARENTLGLVAVTGTGDLIRTGVRTTKGVVGFDLTRLLIGSEGRLAVITEATLKLTPKPQARCLIRAAYRDMDAAARAVSAIMAQPVIPCALEFMDGQALTLLRRQTDLALPANAGALLMIEIDSEPSALAGALAAVAQAATVEGLVELRQAADNREAAQLWAARKALSPALRHVAPKKINEDVVVPVSRMPELIAELENLSRETGMAIVSFGHAGNGNIHVNLLFDPRSPGAEASAQHCLERLFRTVLALGGTLSGEHGIGLAKRDFVAWEIDPVTLGYHQAIQRVFDPAQILNPGKGLPFALSPKSQASQASQKPDLA